MDMCILPVLTYGAQARSFTNIQKSKLNVLPTSNNWCSKTGEAVDGFTAEHERDGGTK